MPLRVGYDNELRTLPGGRARVLARLKRQTNINKEKAKKLNISGNRRQC